MSMPAPRGCWAYQTGGPLASPLSSYLLGCSRLFARARKRGGGDPAPEVAPWGVAAQQEEAHLLGGDFFGTFRAHLCYAPEWAEKYPGSKSRSL
jgi:hypothetical protein